MSLKDRILKTDAPSKEVKKHIRKEALKTMNGTTIGEKASNFFTNRNGYYAFKEMLCNYLLIIFLALTLAAGVACLANIKNMSLSTFYNNPIFICFSCGLALLFCALITKIKYRKQRFKCFAAGGTYTKYTFWKDDITNPKNKKKDRIFK